jgi:photosystem II stability/assembly factor-like uncharacterized protein
MRSLKLLFLVVLLLTNICNSQWTQIPTGISSFLVDLSFVNPDTGWVVGHNQTILKTTNAGQIWIPQTPGNTDDILSVFFISEQIGWIGTSIGLIYKTTDGGNTWSQQYNANFKWITKIFFVNETTGFATIHKYDPDPFLREGAIIKTTNGGQSWSIKTQVFVDGFQCIHFVDELHGFAVGTFGLFSKTTNGGETWSAPIYLTNHWFHTVFFIDRFVGFAAGGNFSTTVIFKTTNGGSSWSLVRNTFEGGILGLSFLDFQRGWACGYNGTMLKTINGGESWVPENSTVTSAIGEMVIFDSTGIAVGDNGLVLKYSHQFTPSNIDLIQPDGGEVWIMGTTEDIIWNSTDVSNVKIEWSYNNGSTWNTIVESYQNIGTYQWTIPPIHTEQARVKISDQINPFTYDISANPFTIDPEIPVELTTFTIEVKNAAILLSWTTASEVNNVGFEIQRSIDNTDFFAIGFVNGYGTTTELNNYKYTDQNVAPGKYYYRLKQVDFDGTFAYSDIVEAEVVGPVDFSLNQNYPNPFNPSTVISFSIPVSDYVTIKIYDMLGNEVGVIVNEELPAGTHTAEFETKGLSSGTYFYRMQAGSFSDTKKMIFLK